MKIRYVTRALSLCCLLATGGCVVAPLPYQPVYTVQPQGGMMVAPDEPMPAPGYVWIQHPRYGWGWHHSRYGWRRGWR